MPKTRTIDDPPEEAKGVIDLDEEQPQWYRLKSSERIVPKDRVYENVRDRYVRMLAKLVDDALPGSTLAAGLLNDRNAAKVVEQRHIFNSYNKMWLPRLRAARKMATEEMERDEETSRLYTRRIDIVQHSRIVKRSKERCERACEAHERAISLMKDLKDFVRGQRIAREQEQEREQEGLFIN